VFQCSTSDELISICIEWQLSVEDDGQRLLIATNSIFSLDKAKNIIEEL